MPNNWKTYKLEEICDLIVDCPHSTPKWKDHGITVLRSNNIRNGKLNFDKESFTDEQHYNQRVKRAIPQGGDLVITREAPMGEVCMLPDELKCCLGQRMVLIRPSNMVDNAFLLYAIQAKEVQNQIMIYEGTGSTVSNLRIPVLEALNIPFPTLPEQRAIASILSSLDDKIELNLQMNKTLEEMAMTLYKHWFVDFDFPVPSPPFKEEYPKGEVVNNHPALQAPLLQRRGSAGGYKSSGGQFIDSELGLIPEGWEVKRLGDIAEVGSSKRIFLKEYIEEGIPFYRGKEIIQLSKGANISTELFISLERYNEIKEKFGVPLKHDILISSVGTIGVSWLVENDQPFYFKDGNLTWIKNYSKRVNGNFISQWLRSNETQDQIKNETIGSTQQALTISALRTLKLALPPIQSDIINDVSGKFDQWNELFIANKREIETLTALRDTLLPKLISGEIRVKDAEQTVAEVL